MSANAPGSDGNNPEEYDRKWLEKLGPYYTIVGQIASVWSMIEYRMDVLIWRVLGLDAKMGASITASIQSPYQKSNAISSLLMELGADELARKIRSFQSEANKSNKERNRAIHDAWFVTLGTGKVSKLEVSNDGGKLILEGRDANLEKLRKTAAASLEINRKFNILANEIIDWVDAKRFNEEPGFIRLQNFADSLQKVVTDPQFGRTEDHS